jgi:hypothetical protein
MPTLVGRTRRQLRAAVLYNVGAIFEGTASATGTTGTIVDNKLSVGATDDYRGCYIWFTSGANNANLIRRVTASVVSSGVTTLTFLPVVADATAAADTYQLIGTKAHPIHPDIVNGFINQAIIEITGLAFDPEESLALHGDGRQKRFDVPSEFKMLSNVYTRSAVESAQIHDGTSDWDEATVANVTRTVDTEHYKCGSGQVRMVVASGAAAGLVLASKAISSLDLRKYDYAEFWVESTVETASGDLQLLLDDTALCVSPVETLSIPALVANTPTYCRVALANPRLDSAIISVGLKYTVDIGACTIWINDVKGVNDSTARWVQMQMSNWYVEEEARDLIFKVAPPYRLMKLVGGDNPLTFTADADVNEVDDQFVIARATELVLLSQGGGPSTDPDAYRPLASYWREAADKAKRAMPWITGRSVS